MPLQAADFESAAYAIPPLWAGAASVGDSGHRVTRRLAQGQLRCLVLKRRCKLPGCAGVAPGRPAGRAWVQAVVRPTVGAVNADRTFEPEGLALTRWEVPGIDPKMKGGVPAESWLEMAVVVFNAAEALLSEGAGRVKGALPIANDYDA